MDHAGSSHLRRVLLLLLRGESAACSFTAQLYFYNPLSLKGLSLKETQKTQQKNCTAKGTKLLLNKGAYQKPVNNVPKARTCLSKRLCSLDLYF